MKDNNIKKIAFSSMFIALVFIATFAFKIPISLGWGYVHLGDSVVMLAGMLLGPVLGGLAAGIGSLLADVSAGYAIYAIPTFIIKAGAAFLVGLGYKSLKNDGFSVIITIYHAIVAFICVVGGYFLTDILLAKLVLVNTEGDTELVYAAYGLLPNALQISFGIFGSLILYSALKKPFDEIYRKKIT